MKPIVTAAEMRALDRATIDEVGLPAMTLMETAGRAVAAAAQRMLDLTSAPLRGAARPGRAGAFDDTDGHIAVVCGPGNNGGDGFVAARVLRELGRDAVVYLAAQRDAVRGDAHAHLQILERAGGVIRSIATPSELAELSDAIAGASLAIDALFGVGLTRDIEGHLADVVDAINHAQRRLAVDIPSGLDADTGRMLGACVSAHRTVTMGALKIALASAPGFARCGDVEIADIGIPHAVVATQAVRAGLVEEDDVVRALPRPAPLDHKGSRGHVLVVGGWRGMRGAGRLAATAVLRSGAGLCTLAAPSDGELVAPDSVMTHVVSDRLGDVLARKTAIVIGPGLGQSELAVACVAEVLASGIPAVLDADALSLHAGKLAALADAAGPLVLTPHPGEAARLLGTTIGEVESDRLAAARAIATRSHAVVALKGARTVVCDGTIGDDFCWINPTGGPALATGGSGDVLAGIIGALVGQGLTAADATRVGVFAHGRAGGQLATRHGERGVMSSDLPLEVSHVLRVLRPE